MQRRIGLALAAILACSSFARAQVVDVTVDPTETTISIGEIATLFVYGQLKPPYDNLGNGIFGWDGDLRVGDTGVVGLLIGTVDQSGWTNNHLTSSPGTPTVWGLDAIYDTGEDDTELGVTAPVTLFSIDFEGLSAGQTTLTIEPDMTTGADFVTWTGQSGGDYSVAWSTINVIPLTFTWQGGSANWAAGNWHNGTTPNNVPETGAHMIVDADTGPSNVTVAADFNSAFSLAIGENHTAAVGVNSGATLYVDNDVSVGPSGTLSGDGTLASTLVTVSGSISPGASIGTLNVNGDCTLTNSSTYEVELRGNDIGAPTIENDKAAVSGQLEVAVGTTLSLDWLPTDETSKFGGTYTLATYNGSEITGLDETDLTFAGNIGEAYVGGIDFAAPGGGGYAVDMLLYDLLAADANLDGVVYGLDFAALVGNWRTSGKDWFTADFNFDGNVDGLDFAALVGSWRDTAGPRPGGGGPPLGLGGTAVPEPGTLVMLLMGAVGLLVFAWRKSRRR